MPEVTEADAKGEEEKLRPAIEKYRRETRFSPFVTPIAVMNLVLLTGGMIGMAWAIIAGAPPLLHLNHVAIVRKDGKLASRLRVLFRMVLTWLPVTIGLLTIAITEASSDVVLVTSTLGGGAALLVTLLAAIYAVNRPERCLQDRIAGTWLVPR
jgi:hypothetical protein